MAPDPCSVPREHHAECRLVTFWALYEQWKDDPELPTVEPPGDPEWAKEAGIMDCHPNCPSLAVLAQGDSERKRRYD